MAAIGERAKLRIVREAPPGLYLDAGGLLGEVLLPRNESPRQWEVDDELDVFLYTDSEDRPVATMRTPKAMPGEFAYLEVLQTNSVGAFLDWGLAKDLLLPFGEQRETIKVGNSYVVRVVFDESSERLYATRRLSRYFTNPKDELSEGQEVDLLIYGKTELGYKAIINGRCAGLLYANEIFRRLFAGERTRGYVKTLRDDGKVDLTLQAPSRDRIEELANRIENELKNRGGRWGLCDKSTPEEISKALGVSKKDFKKATGQLFRARRIVIGDDDIRLA